MLEAILTLVILVMLLCISMVKPKNFPKGPSLWHLITNFNENDKHNQRHFDMVYEDFGEICGWVVPGYRVVIVGGYDMVKETLSNEDCQGRPDVCLLRDRFEGGHYGVLFTSGEEWKTQRRFTLHHFRNLGFGKKTHELIVEVEAEDLVSEIHKTNQKPFSCEELFYQSNINTTWALVASERYKHSDEKLKRIGKSIKDMIHDTKLLGGVPVMIPILRYIMPNYSGYNAVTNGGRVLRSFIKEVAEEHRKTRDPNNPRDFIDVYLNEIEEAKNSTEKSSFTIEQMEGVCMDLLLAGGDTGSNTLSFALLLLCLHPRIQQKIFEEVSSVCGNRKPLVSDRPSFPYLEAFLMEVQRYRTIVPTLVPHRATKSTTLGGYFVPKDTFIFINVKSIFMDKDHWGDPENFRPERFINLEGKVQKDDWLIPFGKGKRSCIGENLAKMSSITVLASLMHSFMFFLPPGDPIPDTKGTHGFLLAPPKYKLIATPRSSVNV